MRELTALPWTGVPIVDRTTDKGHGRTEQRTFKLTAVTAGINFPGAQMALQITWRGKTTTGHQSAEAIYAITDLGFRDVSPAALADAARAHWGIENQQHWAGDVTFAEALSQIRAGNAPAVLATLRNVAISLHRLACATNITQACRRLGRHPNRVIPLIN